MMPNLPVLPVIAVLLTQPLVSSRPAQATPVQTAAQQQSAARPGAEKPIAFDATSIKPQKADAGRGVNSGGPDTSDPGRIHYSVITLKGLLPLE
jgi:hypothetical protein